MARLESGDGKNPDARTNSEGKLIIESESAPRDFFISRDDGQVYTVSVADAGAVADEETIYLQNLSSTKNLIIDDIIIGSDIVSIWRIKFVTGTTTGTVVTPVNLNKTSSNAADVLCRGGAGGVASATDAGDIGVYRIPADDSKIISFEEALILGQNDAITIECEVSCDVNIVIEFHLE